jgi:hypothetical protein
MMTELERLQHELDATMQVVHEETARAARAERLIADKDIEIERLTRSVRDRATCENLQYERAEEAERMLAREIDVASLLQTRAEAAECEAENWKRLLCEVSSRLIAPQKPAE